MTTHKINVTTSQRGGKWFAVASLAGKHVPTGMTTELEPKDTKRDAFMQAVAYLFDYEAARAFAAEQAKHALTERERCTMPTVAHTLEARREYMAGANI